MKKFLLSLAMAITAIGASAQNTYNVRAGGGVLGVLNDDAAAAFTTMAQANISLNPDFVNAPPKLKLVF